MSFFKIAHENPLLNKYRITVDYPLLIGCIALLSLGFVMVSSASSEVAADTLKNEFYYTIRYLVYVLLGVIALLVVLFIPIGKWHEMNWKLLFLSFILLILVFIPGIGREVNGSMRWIHLGFFNIQPSELAKVFVVIFISGYLVRRQDEVRETWLGFFKPFIVLLPMALLLLSEPDFGATVLILTTTAVMLFLGGVGFIRFCLMVLFASVVIRAVNTYTAI